MKVLMDTKAQMQDDKMPRRHSVAALLRGSQRATGTIAVTLLLGGLLSAAVVPRYSTEQLVSHSQLVVLGRVAGTWTAWDSKHKYIWSHHEIQIIETILGGRSTSITVSEPGGTIDGISQQFSGTLPYAQGEDTVVFLYQTPIGYWRTVGGPQGKFSVTRTGLVLGPRKDGASAETIGSISGGQTPGTPLETLDGLNISEFKALIRRFIPLFHTPEAR